MASRQQLLLEFDSVPDGSDCPSLGSVRDGDDAQRLLARGQANHSNGRRLGLVLSFLFVRSAISEVSRQPAATRFAGVVRRQTFAHEISRCMHWKRCRFLFRRVAPASIWNEPDLKERSLTGLRDRNGLQDDIPAPKRMARPPPAPLRPDRPSGSRLLYLAQPPTAARSAGRGSTLRSRRPADRLCSKADIVGRSIAQR